MASVSPWSVKGVEPDAREAAKVAARRAGMTLGQWLNLTIRAAAAAQLVGPSRPSDGDGKTPRPADQPDRDAAPSVPPAILMERTMKRLAERLEKIEASGKAASAVRRRPFFGPGR